MIGGESAEKSGRCGADKLAISSLVHVMDYHEGDPSVPLNTEYEIILEGRGILVSQTGLPT